jgi:hypothetical protein
VLQGLTPLGSCGMGSAAPASTLVSRPGPRRLPQVRSSFRNRTEALPSCTCTSASECSDLGLRVAAMPLRPVRPDPTLMKVAGSCELLSRGSSSPSAQSSGGVHSDTTRRSLPGPKTGWGRGLASAAVFRPRRFYDLDDLLRHPLSPGFPRTTLVGLDHPSGSLPIREDTAVTGAAFPS